MDECSPLIFTWTLIYAVIVNVIQWNKLWVTSWTHIDEWRDVHYPQISPMISCQECLVLSQDKTRHSWHEILGDIWGLWGRITHCVYAVVFKIPNRMESFVGFAMAYRVILAVLWWDWTTLCVSGGCLPIRQQCRQLTLCGFGGLWGRVRDCSGSLWTQCKSQNGACLFNFIILVNIIQQLPKKSISYFSKSKENSPVLA